MTEGSVWTVGDARPYDGVRCGTSGRFVNRPYDGVRCGTSGRFVNRPHDGVRFGTSGRFVNRPYGGGEMWYERAIRESPLRWGKAKMGAEEMVCSGKRVQEYEKNLKKFEIDTVSACHFMYFILKYIRLERNSLTIQ